MAPRIIVALWGIERDYGRHTGGFPVIGALATLAYDGRRDSYFRRELLAALKILDQGHIELKAMTGSWAGAMGQSQFMPTSFHAYAQDHDGDGRRDIWHTPGDVFASAANYLAKSGWRRGQTWGREVRLPAGFDSGLAEAKVLKDLAAWQRLGVRRANGGALPKVAPGTLEEDLGRYTVHWSSMVALPAAGKAGRTFGTGVAGGPAHDLL